MPRFRIAWVMVAVAVAALDFGAIRAFLHPPMGDLLLLGTLPMANVLVAGVFVGQRHAYRRPFLLGFEAAGGMALASYLVGFEWFPGPFRRLVIPYLDPWLHFSRGTFGRAPSFAFILTACAGAVVLLGGPQLALALLGGFLSRRFYRPSPSR